MNKRTCQNGVSSPQLYGYRYDTSTSNAPTSHEASHCSSLPRASKSSSQVAHMSVSNRKLREREIFQSREVFLKLLQPPVFHAAPGSGCPLPYQEEAKTCFKPDGSHCSRCLGFQPPQNQLLLSREADWTSKTVNGTCVHLQTRERQGISHRKTGDKHFQSHRDLDTAVDLQGYEEDLPRKERTSVMFPTTTRCQSCEARVPTCYPEEFHLRSARCQQHSNGSHCFRKETLQNDPNSDPLHKERQIEDNRAVISRRESLNDAGNFKRVYLPTWRYHGNDSRVRELSPSKQTLARDHPNTGTRNAEIPDHVRPMASVDDAASYFDERARLVPPPATKDKPSEPSCSGPEDFGFAPSGPSDESLQDESSEERNTRLQKASGKSNAALPHCPNENSQVIESQMDECTPIILHCYSLSEPDSSSDSQIMKKHINEASLSMNGEAPWVPGSHSAHRLYQQPSLKSLQSASCLQDDEDVLYDSPVLHPRSNTNTCNHVSNTQNEHVTNKASSTAVGVDDKQKQKYSTSMLPIHVHGKHTPQVNCCSLNCHPDPHANGCDTNCIQRRRSPYPSSQQCPEPINTSESVSPKGIIHIPNGYHMTHSTTNGPIDVESGPATFYSWPKKQVPRGSRRNVKIHDYYEERRILVGKFYQDIPGSVDVAESEQSSNARRKEIYHEDQPNSQDEGAEVFQTPACEDRHFEIRVHQQDIAVGSKKRKRRQPRPQRVNSNIPAQFTRTEGDQEQYEGNEPEFPLKNGRYHQINSSYLQDASTPKEAFPKAEEDMDARGKESQMRSHEDVQAPFPVHFDSVRRCDDDNFENISSRSSCYSREIHPEAHPTWHSSFEGRKTAERRHPFLGRDSLRDIPPFGAFGNRLRPTNRISLEYQMNLHCQSKDPQKIFENSHGNMTQLPENVSTERNAAQQPIWMTGPENHFGTLEKGGPGYGSGHRRCPFRMRMSSSGPLQHSTYNENNATFHAKVNSESPESAWNGAPTPGYAERQEDNFGYHAEPVKGKPLRKSSNTPSSLPSDHGSVSTSNVDDSDALEKAHCSDRPLEIHQTYVLEGDNISGRQTKERNAMLLENRNYFLETQDMFPDYMTPAMKERRFVCRYCSKKFAHFSTLQNHLRTHTGDKPFQCKFCNRRFAQSGVLKAHVRTHTGDKPFACMYCGKVFAQSTTLTNHLRTHTGQKPYVCNFCGKSFTQPSTLRKHELSHTKERPYSCKFCGKAFAQQSTLTNHLRSHTGQRPYKCHFCEKSFAQLSTLDRHLRLHSSVSLKPHQCQFCSKSFSYVSNLVSHMQVHEKEQCN